MTWKLRTVLGAGALFFAAQAMAQIIFYEGEEFRGRTFAVVKSVGNFKTYGFNDRASSVIVDRGRWEVCENAFFEGRCMVLRPGSYDSLKRMGMNDRVSSARPVDERRHYENESPQPLAAPTYKYRRRPNERLYEAPVTSVHAVMGAPERHCWVERQQVVERDRSGPNVGGAIAGAIIGGILGHQIGHGPARDAATAGGAVAGAAIGANAGRDGDRVFERDVRRCEKVASGPPDYWEVTYKYRGMEHRAQMSAPPGRTILVNGYGEPRA